MNVYKSHPIESAWTLNRRKALINVVELLELTIDNGAFGNWSHEFDNAGFSVIHHFVRSAVLVATDDAHASFDESSWTSQELICRLLYVSNHGIASLLSNPTVFFEDLERDPSILRYEIQAV